ncbi:hypothetical protein An09g03080 [Aspergillus niger]|uniref:Uncharacterized protein n=2 Tax=Aspergillus niger TaxID=5061 RepID=A2QTS2_ASPNC|nr:hypothetical protein An09g03080 [Aspergillus niger]CAK40247.1 hypothetical protein An09g03080 [Aspergillus niger]
MNNGSGPLGGPTAILWKNMSQFSYSPHQSPLRYSPSLLSPPRRLDPSWPLRGLPYCSHRLYPCHGKEVKQQTPSAAAAAASKGIFGANTINQPDRIHAQAKRYLKRQQYGGVQPISVTKKLYWPSSKTLYTIVQVMSYCHQVARFLSIFLGGNFGSDKDGPSRLVAEGPGFD